MKVSGLTDVARVCEPLDIHTQVGPPEMLNKVGMCHIHTTVSYFIMGLCEELEMASRRGYDLVVSI